MPELSETIDIIIKHTEDNTLSEAERYLKIESAVKAHSASMLNLFVNIGVTSTNESDRNTRIRNLCNRFGLYEHGGRFY